ncbi:hypothetical protein B0A55_03713 [Friedmanniomyces simplex]|uniref:F-box domain-containing protein n=1 Tax=Friedmanniomyces simplex TaxID=329884 RepID=A0A4U0XNJ4_9PEZI|nr:hypothetical protein B0A55_03713 [Friedmanniomyces simplex]
MAATQQTSRLLTTLPAEIRNEIWDLAFSGTGREVDLLHQACPPSSALLLSCPQIYAEAKSFWPNRRREYWESTSFFIKHDPTVTPNETTTIPAGKDLNHIRKINFRVLARILFSSSDPNSRPIFRMLNPMTLASPPTSDIDTPLVFKRRGDCQWHCADAHGLVPSSDPTFHMLGAFALYICTLQGGAFLSSQTSGWMPWFGSFLPLMEAEIRALLGMQPLDEDDRVASARV